MVRLSQIVVRAAESRRPRSLLYLFEPEMIAAIRVAILKPQVYCSHLKSAFFHSTPILQRKHQSNSKARSKRLGRKRAKLNFRRNIWSDGFDYSGKHTSCFEKQYSRVSKRNRNGRYIPHNFEKYQSPTVLFNCIGCFEEEFDIDYILRTALGGSRGFSCSFTHEGRKPGGRAKNFSWSNYYEESEPRSETYFNNFRRSQGSRHINLYAKS